MLQYTQKTRQLGTSSSPNYHELPVGTISAGATQTTGRQFFIPIRIDQKLTIGKIGCHATSTVATAVARVGVYKDAGLAYPRPGVLVGEAASTLDVSAAGYPEGTLTTTTGAVARPGLVWLSIVTQTAAATLDACTNVENAVPLNFGTTKPAAVGTVGAYYKAGVTGALADVGATDTLVGAVVSPWLFYAVYGS